MNRTIPEIYSLLQDLSWYFGNQGFDGECCDGLSLVEYMSLKKICSTKDITIQEISTALNITKGGTSKVIDRLEEKSFALRKQSPEDGRVCCVQATKKGLNAVRKIAEQNSAYLAEALNIEEDTTLVAIKDVLGVLRRAIQEKGYIK